MILFSNWTQTQFLCGRNMHQTFHIQTLKHFTHKHTDMRANMHKQGKKTEQSHKNEHN